MLRAVSTIYIESKVLARRDVLKFCRVSAAYSTASGNQTVIAGAAADSAAAPPAPAPAAPPPAERAARPARPRRAWRAAAALALTASLGGVYLYRRLRDDAPPEPAAPGAQQLRRQPGPQPAAADAEAVRPEPASAEQLPAHVQYLLVGGGTASFAAMRAIRSARPDAQVLIVSEEDALPYMRPPLSKEVWREPAVARDADALTYRQWNGRRRAVSYEPPAFYAPAERLRDGGGGAAVARGWRVERLEPERRAAELVAATGARRRVTYDSCLLATGSTARRVPALRAPAAAGRSLALRTARDAARLADALDAGARTVLIVGGGLLATELGAALADRLRETGGTVQLAYREAAPLSRLLPDYLAAAAARRLAADGVRLLPRVEVVDSEVLDGGRVLVRMAGARREGEECEECEEVETVEVEADVVVECVGGAADTRAAAASALEVHEALGGVVVNAELAARAGVYAAGDAACYHDAALGRRRVHHHDHAVASGRRAGENMVAERPRAYTHQPMFWSDLGPRLGYEAVGLVDSRLPTVAVFAAAREEGAAAAAGAGAGERAADAPGEERLERGVVFYLREGRVVGVLLWNLFNRMQLARQVLAQSKFEDLFELAKLFAPHEQD